MNYDGSITELLYAFINNTRMLTSLFTDDKEYFKQNNIEMIEQNNQKKTLLNHQLTDIITALQKNRQLSTQGSTIYQRLANHANQLTGDEHQEMTHLLQTMQDEIVNYSRVAAINRQVIQANVTYLKQLFAAIVNDPNRNQQADTYDCLGALEHG